MATPLLTGPNLGIALRPMLSEVWCGDQAEAWDIDGKIVLCMVDGLGHGEYADKASHAALDYLKNYWSWDWTELLLGCDHSIAHSRGVALGIAAIDLATRLITFVGLGNIRLMAVGSRTRNLQAIPGIVGAGRFHVRPETLPLDGIDCIIMFTDGIESSLDVSKCPTSLFANMEALAAAIVHGWGRSHDDAGVIAWHCPVASQRKEGGT